MPQQQSDTVRLTLSSDTVVNIPGVGEVTFPASMSADEVNAAAKRLHDEAAPKPEEKSVGGFVRNTAGSALKFGTDTVKGFGSVLNLGRRFVQAQAKAQTGDSAEADKLRQEALDLLKNAPAIGGALWESIKKRYGSIEAIGNTLYTDPVGVLADLSSVTGGGAVLKLAKVGKVAKVAKAAGIPARVVEKVGRVGDVAVKASDKLNPLHYPAKGASALLDEAGTTAIRFGVRPSANVRGDIVGGGRALANVIKKENLFSENMATKKLVPASKKADELIAKAMKGRDIMDPDIYGQQSRFVDALRSDPNGPGTAAVLNRHTGKPDEMPAVEARIKAFQENAPATPDGGIPLDVLQIIKQTSQEAAYESGRVPGNTIAKLGDQTMARTAKEILEEKIPEIGPVNERTHNLAVARNAFREAEDRSNATGNVITGLAATGGAAGGSWESAAAAAAFKALSTGRGGAATGVTLDKLSQGVNSTSMQRALLIARLVQQGMSEAEAEQAIDRASQVPF